MYFIHIQTNNSVASVRVQNTPPSDSRLSVKLVPTFDRGGCRLVSEADPYGRNLDFIELSPYFFFQVAP
jgi:hypothetical protein